MDKIGFLGAGKMAQGILAAIDDRRRVLMAEKVEAVREAVRVKFGVKVTDDVAAIARECNLVFLAVRPNDVDEVAAAVKPLLKREQTLVSIVAGKTLAKLRKAFGPKVKIVRVMPNLALRVGEGMCAITPKNAKVEEILGAAGKTVVLKEKDFNAVTALSGSGPAYFAYMQKMMAAAGVKLGLKPSVAALLSAQTMYGTAKFLKENPIDLDEFIAGVCTKGGTTAAGMVHLGKAPFAKAVEKTLAAAAKRSAELAGA